MKITVILWICFFLQGSALGVHSQSARVSINVKQTPLVDVLDEMERQTDYLFFYSKNNINAGKQVTVNENDAPVSTILDKTLDSDIAYTMVNNHIVLSKKEDNGIVSALQQSGKKIAGKIVDQSGEPVVSATVLEKGTLNGTLTDVEGNFTLTVGENAVLQVSYIGYIMQEVGVTNRSSFNIVLAEDLQTLEEVVVVGYGTQRKSDVTGSIAVATADDILKTNSFNALAGLKGKASGVNIFTNSGQPGGSTRVMIRGIGTINSSSSPLYVVDGVVMEDFQFLNPNDIERVEVLKDASAAAIYGARGANGVILVTSRRGLTGGEGTRLGYSGYVGIATPASRMEVMNSAQFMEAMKVSYENNRKWYGGTQTFSVKDSRLFDSSGNPLYDTDWQKEATRTAISHNHQLSIQQGGKTSSVGAFLNYTDQQGVMINTFMKRINTKLTYDAQPTKWVSTAINLLVNHTWQNDTDEGGGSQVARRTMIEMPSIFPVKWPDGTWTNSQSTDDFTFEAMANPVHLLTNQERLRMRTQIFGNAALIFHLAPGLDLRTQFGVDAHLRKWKEYYTTDLINISYPDGYAYMSDTQILYWQQENYLNYLKTFGKHRVYATAGLTWQQRTYAFATTNGVKGFTDNFYSYNNLGVATTPDSPSSSWEQWAMNSYFLRGSYTYNDRYMATLTARMDGSSKFGKNNKYAFFPAVGIGWLASNEDFMKDISAIDLLKLHASYGVTGNSEISPYRSLAMVSSGTYLIDGARQAYSYASRLPNPDLQWEKTNQFDVGLNLNLFGNRMNFDVSYYYKLTTDLLLDRPVPHSTGYNSVFDNIGSVSNRGIDFMLNTVNLKNNNFEWTSTVNLNFNRNRIEKLGENNEDILPDPSWVSGSQTILRVGESASSFWGYERLGVWTQEEEAAALAAGARVGQAKRSEAKKILGKGIPDLTGSFINTFNYRNFDLTVDLQFVTGVEILQQFSHSAEDRFGYTSGLASILTEGYNGTNPNTMVQAVRNANLSGQSSELDSRWVCDGSYLRGNVIQLGYNFDRKTLGALNLSALRIYASVNNAFVLHSKDFRGYDPEGTSQGDQQWGQNMFFYQYPKPRTFLVGLNVTF